jgi:hypothetical protein
MADGSGPGVGGGPAAGDGGIEGGAGAIAVGCGSTFTPEVCIGSSARLGWSDDGLASVSNDVAWGSPFLAEAASDGPGSACLSRACSLLASVDV